MRRLLPPLALVVVLFTGSEARAQTVVYDPTAVGKLLQTYQAALKQLEALKAQVAQGDALFAHFNTASGVNGLAAELSSPTLRAFLPDAQTYVAAAKGDLSALGALGAAASSIRAANRIYTPAATDVAGKDLERAGDRAARDLALGQQVANVSAARLQGLQTLQNAIDGAKDVRAVMDLQTRLQAEQALITNDQVRLQGLAMAQAAEQRMQEQRDREIAEKAHADAQIAFRRMTQ